MNGATYVIVHRVSGQAGIMCKICHRVSWHPQDVEFLFCGNCHQFHADMQAQGVPPAPRPVTLYERITSLLERKH